MIRVSLRGLLQRKLRALLTALAVVLGVAMVSGTFMLTDSIEKAFDSIFTSSYSETDVVVSGKPIVEGSASGNPLVPVSLLADVRALPGVEAAAGMLVDLEGSSNTTRLIDADGKQIGTAGAPSLGVGVDPGQPRFNPLRLTEGAWARHDGDVVIDAGTAKSEGLEVGNRIGVAASGPIEQFTISGIAKYGDVESLGGATIAVFDLPTAQRVLRKDGYDSISVAGRDGATVEELVRQIRPLLPATAEVKSASARAAADSKQVSDFIAYLRYALLGFGGIALFVGAFVIFNTLSITVAQRTREFATLRTIGASRRQIMRSVVLETFVIGVLASLTGLGLGYLLANGLGSVFGLLGLGLPEAGTIVAVRTVVLSLGVGIAITLVAGIVPAIRSTRVAPIDAVREGSAVPSSRLARHAPLVAAAILALSLAALAYGLLAADVPAPSRLLAIGAGSLGVFLGVAMLAPRLVRPLAAFVGFPAERLGGAAGTLARSNAVRNPGRTASTAAALMIGLTLVTAVAVLGQGLRTTLTSTVERQIEADYIVTSANGVDTLPPSIGEQIAALPGVERSSVRSDRANALGEAIDVSGVDGATIGSFYRFRFSQGTDAALATLRADGALVRKSFADKHHLRSGSALPLLTPTGERLQLRVAAVVDLGKFDIDPLLGAVVIGQRSFDAAFARPGDRYTFVHVDPAAAALAGQAIEQGAKQYPGVTVSTRDEFVASRVDGIGQIVNLLYVLLALSVVVSLFGMVNTLVLAVFERTREIGMLRAIGLTPRQTRRIVRHESIITALIGASLALPLGIGLAALVTRALAEYDEAFSVPGPTLAVFVVVAVAAGLLAAILPARRAGRLDVLQALSYE